MENISIKHEDIIYSSKFQSKDNQTLIVELREEMLLKFNGSINLTDIYKQIRAFQDYTIDEVFSIMKDLPQEKFNLKKDSDKYELDIAFPVMKKEKHLIINLNPVTESKENLIQSLTKIIKDQENKINDLEKEINELKINLANKGKGQENNNNK